MLQLFTGHVGLFPAVGWDDALVCLGGVVDDLADGFHRVLARRLAKFKRIDAEIRQGREGPVWDRSHDRYYHAQSQIAKKAKVKWGHDALRHTCISARVALERTVPQIAYESGNSEYIIKRDYLDLMPPSAAKAWFAVTPAVVSEYRRAREESEKTAATKSEA